MTHSKKSAGTGNTDRSARMEIIIGGLVLLLAIAAIVFSRKFPSTGLATDIGSARFPLVYSCALIVLCAVLIARNLAKLKQPKTEAVTEPDAEAEVPNYRRTAIGIAVSALSLFAMQYLGYALVTAGYLSFLMWLLGMKHKAWNPLLAIVITALLYFTFSTGLNVPLPVGSLFE